MMIYYVALSYTHDTGRIMPCGTGKGPGGRPRGECEKTKLKNCKREEEQDISGEKKAARLEKARIFFSPVVRLNA